MKRAIAIVAVAVAAFASGCAAPGHGSDDASIAPDAASLDGASVDAGPLPVGDFGCAGQPLPAVAADPISLTGHLSFALVGSRINDAAVEVRTIAGDTLLGRAVTATLDVGPGAYRISVATGGTAQAIYRKVTHPSYVTAYMYDSRPLTASSDWPQAMHTLTTFEDLQRQAGFTPEEDKGVLSVSVRDCSQANGGERVAGATVAAPPGARVVYVNAAGAPDATLSSTTAWGEALVVGVTPGIVDLNVSAGPVRYRSWPVRVDGHTWTLSARQP